MTRAYWIVTWKGCGRKWSRHWPWRIEENHKETLIKIIGVLTEIRNSLPQNTCQNNYFLTRLVRLYVSISLWYFIIWQTHRCSVHPTATQNKNNKHLTSNIKTFRKQFESTSTSYLCTKLLIPSCNISVVNAVTLKSKKRGNVRKRNMGGRSPNYCCHGRTLIITYSECVFVDLLIQLAMRMRYIVICGLYGSTVFFRIIS